MICDNCGKEVADAPVGADCECGGNYTFPSDPTEQMVKTTILLD